LAAPVLDLFTELQSTTPRTTYTVRHTITGATSNSSNERRLLGLDTWCWISQALEVCIEWLQECEAVCDQRCVMPT
jgi:hypothetical protein